MLELYQSREVFTPNVPATLSFVERSALNDRLIDALRTPRKQILVFGHSGSGKTTLLSNKVQQIYGDRKIVSRCTVTTSFEDLLLGAFAKENHDYQGNSGKELSGNKGKYRGQSKH